MLFKELYNEYGHIYYEDDAHIYVDTKTGNVLTSVTTVLKKYQTPFPRDYMSKKMVNNPKKPHYKGMTQKEILELWDDMALAGNTAGSILHNYLETAWFNKYFPVNYDNYSYCSTLTTERFILFHEKCSKMIHQADQFLLDHPHIIPVRSELIVGNDINAGQIDFLGYDTIEEEYVLFDYKTDKEIKYNNQYQNFKKPLTHLEDCNFNKYCLQVNFYRRLLKPVIDLKTMYIIWFNKDNDSYVKLKVKKDDKNIDSIL